MPMKLNPSPNNPLRQMGAEALYAQLGRIIESAPDLKQRLPLNPRTSPQYLDIFPAQMQWLGRARALAKEALGADAEFGRAMDHLRPNRAWAADQIMQLLYRALAVVEMELPAPSTGAYIPAGNSFDALKAVQRVFETAQSDILIVDPYMDEKILTDFAVLAKAGTSLRLLTDSGSFKASLRPALKYFQQQYGADRPLEVRAAPPRSLHDRMIATDGARIWTVGQSFNALAARAPTSFVEVDKETAALKMAAYDDVWGAAAVIRS